MSENGNPTAPEAVSRRRVKAPEQRPVFLAIDTNNQPASFIAKRYVVVQNGVAVIKQVIVALSDDSPAELARAGELAEQQRDKLVEG